MRDDHADLSRRHLFRIAAALAAAAAMLAIPAANSNPAAAQATPVKHVVVIYLENHTFDSLLGFWCQANPARCPDGGMPASVTLKDGSTLTPTVSPDKVPGLNHSVAGQVADMDGGKMDGWTNPAAVSGYQPAQIPDITSLASQFAISDMTFSENNSPSWGGHLDIAAGTQDGFTGDIPSPNKAGLPTGPGWGCDSNRIAKWGPAGKFEPSCIPAAAATTLTGPYAAHGGAFRATPVHNVPTIMDRLSAAGLSWDIFGGTYAQATAPGANTQLGGNVAGYGWSICPSFAGCLDTSQDQNLISSGDFQDDAINGDLPAFSIVTPGGPSFKDSCHNGMSMTACDNWVGSLVSSVENGPEWDSTAVFITWDDMGGFYDQVPPPAGLNADGTPDGPRVPLVIVSPYARAGYTDTTPDTFAGILAFTEHTFGLASLAANDAAAYDFSDAVDYSQVPLKPVRMVRRPLPAWARHIRLTKAMLDDPT